MTAAAATVPETDLCAIVVDHFRVRGYTVFQEVNLGGRCDIVARQHRLAFAVEVKAAANLAVLAQAVRHVGRAHGVYVAAPCGAGKTSWRAFEAFADVARACGIGVLRIWRNEHPGSAAPHGVMECSPARITRWLDPAHEIWLKATLTPEHAALGGIAGSPSSSAAWTGFKQFQREVWQVLRRHGPMTVAQIAKALHADENRWSHYRWGSDVIARRAIHGYMSKGLFPCIECVDATRPAKWAAVGTEFRIP